jgi:hypothetical protein
VNGPDTVPGVRLRIVRQPVAADSIALLAALQDIVAMCDDHTTHTQDRVHRVRACAASALLAAGLAQPRAPKRTT